MFRQKVRWTVAALIAAGTVMVGAPAEAQCPGGRYTLLTNGRIHTMDAKRSVVSRVLVANGKVAAVGEAATDAGGCTDTIDLGGRTVIPGMIDNHFHVLLVANRPGWETRQIETAFSIAELQQVVRERAKGMPPGAFMTAVGGIQAHQLAENRLPTLAELDAAAPGHAVYLHFGRNGPAATNSIGKRFFESRGITVSADGMIAQDDPSWDALDALYSVWAHEDKKRTAQQVFSYFNSVGLTTVHSVAGSLPRHPTLYFTPQDHEPVLDLLKENKLTLRLRLYWNTGARVDGQPGNPPLRELLDNHLRHFGNDMVRTAGVGEHIVDWPLEGAVPLGEEYYQSTLLLASRGWQLMEHSFSEANHATRADIWERVNQVHPITNLRWSIDHVANIQPQTLERMRKLGVGIRVHGYQYLSGGGRAGGGGGRAGGGRGGGRGAGAGAAAAGRGAGPGPASSTAVGPPYRMLIDSGMPVAAGFDGAQAAPINPWLQVYYMVTGRNVRGDLINDGNQITRQEAVWLYTAANGWFSREENTLGSIEPGRHADLVVLNADVFDPQAVPDAEIRRVHSVLTLVGGKVVYGDPKTLGR